MIEKRMAEIKARKLEIRESLQGENQINLEEVKTELDNLEVEERSLIEKREIAEKINIGELQPTKIIEKPMAKEELRMENKFESMEYRQNFMNYVLKGEKIADEFRADAITKTTDIGAVIPQTVLNTIIEKLEASGMILPLVTRTAVKGGVSIPTSNLKPVATWVAEGAGSDKQKKTTGGSITFAYHKLRCAVAVSLEVDTMALSAFESVLIANVVEAMTKALEQSIISGSGVGQPKGILTETPNAGQAVEVSKIGYNTLIDAESALPMEYEAGAVYVMTKKTFMAYAGMVDSQGQPIARVNFGITGKPERVLLGRPVVLCNYLPSYDVASAGDAFAFLFNFKDYILNTNYNMGLKKYEDNETDDIITKAIMIADGKVVVKDSLVVLKKA